MGLDEWPRAARQAEGQPGSQVRSIWQIIVDKTQTNQRSLLTRVWGPEVVGLGGAGACWGTKCFDNYGPLLNHQHPPPSHTHTQTHTRTCQGQTRSQISNPSTESLLQLTVHLEEVKIDSRLNTECWCSCCVWKSTSKPSSCLISFEYFCQSLLLFYYSCYNFCWESCESPEYNKMCLFPLHLFPFYPHSISCFYSFQNLIFILASNSGV